MQGDEHDGRLGHAATRTRRDSTGNRPLRGRWARRRSRRRWKSDGGPSLPPLTPSLRVRVLPRAMRELCSPWGAFPINKQVSRRTAWSLIFAGYVCGFGVGAVDAVHILLDPSVNKDKPSRTDWIDTITDVVSRSGLVLATTALALLLVAYCCGTNRLPRWHGWQRELRVGSTCELISAFAIVPMAVIGASLGYGDYGLPDHLSGQDIAFGLSTMPLAGLGEEPLFTVLIPVALRASGYRWPTVLVVSAGLRVLFHLYYGPGAIFLAVWAAAAVVVVQRTGCLWGVCVTHGIWDLSGFLWAIGNPITKVATSVGAAVLVLGMVLAILRLGTRLDGTEARVRKDLLPHRA